MLPTRKYPAKVILFGEYTVLIGGDILAVPYSDFYTYWELKPTVDQRLLDFINYLFELDSEVLDYKLLLQIEELIKHGWQLTSTISIGAGLGSSGSVVAAVFDFVGNQNLAIAKLRPVFQLMENYFHGQSSGIDPLVSYLNTNIVIQSGELHAIDAIRLPRFTLYNSGIERQTQALVSWFKSRLAEDKSFEASMDQLKQLNNSIISALLNDEVVERKITAISNLQSEKLSRLIPKVIQSLWNKEESEIWKICGAGGGGYFLQFSKL